MNIHEVLRKSALKKAMDSPYELGRTSEDGKHPHYHRYRINGKGHGKTVKTVGEGADHIHKIVKYKADSAGSVPHTHNLDKESKA